MKNYAGKTAVITGAGSGFGLEVARLAAARGMNLVLCDVQVDALARAAAEFEGHAVLAQRVDVAKAAEMEALAADVQQRFGAPHFVFNNAGVGSGGLIWENSVADWEWVLGVNLMGVVHGIRLFTPMMLAAAAADPSFEGHIVNTASMAGVVNAPNMGVYNVSKHAVVSLTETLYQDLALVTEQIHCSLLCPFFVPTGIAQSHRNRPAELKGSRPTQSQLIGQAMSDKAVNSGKVTAAEVAAMVFAAMDAQQFYIFSHPQALSSVQTRMDDVLQRRNPSDPFQDRPELGDKLKAALKGG
ncbi:SDR family oxidoreductase [Roseateles oligotrophus]|uniref:SDR family oxidoreductase n=1 Tax=Roseateles oligotrophus TaxID=1769250 RepID=A0ABT2YGC1_9BURK|nr:SDR family oxidoreductase [Roseateles oligotrophus]MCV2369093.1 SDR family oxidoreductase [Roseateles oligotrophus]